MFSSLHHCAFGNLGGLIWLNNLELKKASSGVVCGGKIKSFDLRLFLLAKFLVYFFVSSFRNIETVGSGVLRVIKVSDWTQDVTRRLMGHYVEGCQR